MRKWRSVFISDTHIGMRWSRTDILSSFLKELECERIYLVGDIIDCWKLKGISSLMEKQRAIIERIQDLAKRMQLFYIKGNHDDSMHDEISELFGGIKILDSAEHRTIDGRRMLVTHGDKYDRITSKNKWLAHIGDKAYEGLLWGDWLANMAGGLLGMKKRSLSGFVKRAAKEIVKLISGFNSCVADEIREMGLDGIICGHIHRPMSEQHPGFSYYNCGDWIEHCSALIEEMDGSLGIFRWDERMGRMIKLPSPAIIQVGELSHGTNGLFNLFSSFDSSINSNHDPVEISQGVRGISRD